MDFVAIIIFLILYYIRPQEWIGFVTELKPVKWSIVFALITMVFRERGFHPRDLVRTPHDWLMLAYFAWIVLSNPAIVDTFNNNYNLFVFYIVTVQALSSIRRLQAFLGWWTLMILVVAALAVAAPLGFDLVGSNDLTEWRMKGRLVFNTSIFNNPNALGHSIYPVVFFLYFLLFWKRPVFLKIAAAAIVLLPLWCVYLTVSKGAFIGIFVTTIAALTFGRPKVVQILVLVGALTFGWTVLWSMPRMSELQKSSTDQAIQGRIAAFKYGLETLKTDFNGIGIHQFVAGVERAYGFKKAAHSSYVQVGGELGWPGLILFVSLLYACARTLFNAKTTDVTEERVRRALFV
ncbi:MAG: O-antigen ligase family protein, partial [Verrucomicrobiales bacterium]|nr:O-antigen ligase family protein [Verrucomicrobiales bacterium]